MNLDKDIKYIEFMYKTGYKPAFPFISWDNVKEILKHKKGIKPLGFRLYSGNGIYLLTLEPKYEKVK